VKSALLWLLLMLPSLLQAALPDTLWTRTYSIPARNVKTIVQTADGGFLALLTAINSSDTATAMQLRKLSASGTAGAIMSFTGLGRFTAASLVPAGNDQYWLVGTIDRTNSTVIWVAQVDAEGAMLWSRRYLSGQINWANTAAATPEGGLLIGCSTNSSDYRVLKLDADGTLLWNSPYPLNIQHENYRTILNLAPLAAGGIVICGRHGWWGSEYVSAWKQAWASTMSDSGVIRYTQAWQDGRMPSSGDRLLALPGGGCLMAGQYLLSAGDAYGNLQLVRFTDTLGIAYARTYHLNYGQGMNPVGLFVRQDTIIIVANRWTLYPNTSSGYVLEATLNGDSLWTQDYPWAGSSFACAAPTADGFITGTNFWGTTDSLRLTRFVCGVSAVPQRPELPAYRLSQNYPNPFNATTRISFDLPRAQRVSLKVYNLLGQKVATLADGVLTSGSHELSFDGSHLASGVYLYRLDAGSFVQSRKMLLLK
jgi:hypothetical protein